MALDEQQIKEAKKQWEGVPLTFDQEKLTKWYTQERGGADVFYLMFGITYNCQLKCPHCCVGNYENEPPRELTNEEIKDVIDQSSKAFAINFFGGEPTTSVT